MDSVTTNYTLDLNAGLTQVLADGTNTYLYGNGRIGELQPAGFAYHLGDALGSVRQLTDATGSVTLARSYEPYGSTLTSASVGSSNSVFQYTGEMRDASTGLTFLRARYLNNVTGRFISRDTYAGNAQRPTSYNAWLYGYSNPITWTDPSGRQGEGPGGLESFLTGLSGPALFGMCFDLHTGTQGEWYSPTGMVFGEITAGMAVGICREAFSQARWSTIYNCGTVSDALPATTHDLFGQYLCEKGKVHSYFGGNDPLTRELALSSLISGVRARYYIGGGTTVAEQYRFNEGQFGASIVMDSKGSWFKGSLPLTFMLGSFWFQVKKLPDGRVGFRIDNDTTIESGTHIKGRFDEVGSIEGLISSGMISEDTLLRDAIKMSVISILAPRTRNETGVGYGGGNMLQTFTWTERDNGSLACAVLVDRAVFGWMWTPANIIKDPGLTGLEEKALDIQPWDDYVNWTEDPLANIPVE